MTPDDVAEIFVAASAAHQTATSEPAYADIDKFD